MRWPVLVLVFASLATGCGSAADDATARDQVETARQQVLRALDDIVPAAQRAAGAKVERGELHYVNCHYPVITDAQVAAEVQLGYSRTGAGAVWQGLVGLLRKAGWEVDASGATAAVRDGYELGFSMQGAYPTLSLRSPCIETSKEVGTEYAARPRTKLPAPWHPVS